MAQDRTKAGRHPRGLDVHGAEPVSHQFTITDADGNADAEFNFTFPLTHRRHASATASASAAARRRSSTCISDQLVPPAIAATQIESS